MIADVICQAESPHEIYFLLTSYTESLQFAGIAGVSPDIVSLPFTDERDLKIRFIKLLTELDRASRKLDDKSCTAIKEALHVFGAALTRLRAIEKKSYGHRSGESKTVYERSTISVPHNPY